MYNQGMKGALVTTALLGLGTLASAQFSVFAAETVSGSLGGNTSLYGGVRQYNFAGNGAAASPGTGIAASQLNDAAGVMMNSTGFYVSNRHGNTLGQGSIQQFSWDGASFSGGATIVTNAAGGHQGFHGFSMGTDGDIFVSTVNSGTRRFRDSGSGYVDIGGTSSGAVRDAWISPDGQTLIESGLNGNVLVSSVTASTITFLTSFSVSGSNSNHQLVYKNGGLYVASFNSGTVHRIELDAQYRPTSSSLVVNSSAAIGLAFSPDGNEMFVASHTGNRIDRFMNSGSGWTASGSIATGHNMGYLAATPVPEPATMIALGLGAASLLKRRRR